MTRNFISLIDVYHDLPIETERYLIQKHKTTEEDIKTLRDSDSIGSMYADKMLIGQEHIILTDKSTMTVMMSDHVSETLTNQVFLDSAKGDVLIFGLGLGLIVFPLLLDEGVRSLTIVEKDRNLIEVVGEILKSKDLRNIVKIIEGDAYNYFESMLTTYDIIYFDIWPKIDTLSFQEMDLLHSYYRQFLNENGQILSWCQELKV